MCNTSLHCNFWPQLLQKLAPVVFSPQFGQKLGLLLSLLSVSFFDVSVLSLFDIISFALVIPSTMQAITLAAPLLGSLPLAIPSMISAGWYLLRSPNMPCDAVFVILSCVTVGSLKLITVKRVIAKPSSKTFIAR